MSRFRRFKLPLIVATAYLVLMVLRRDMALQALGNSTYYLFEMAQILPVIFLLTVSIDVLIPREWIVRRLGNRSGVSGAVLALAFGSLSAGPIYAAFPIAKMLHAKGASIGNVVVILSAWAVIKVPMLANEAKFLGPGFMLARWVLTVLFIFAMAWIMEKTGVSIRDEGDDSVQRASVREAYCMGCALCEKRMPEFFSIRNGKAHIVQTDPPNPEQLVQLAELAEQCPVHAIVLADPVIPTAMHQ